MMSLLFLLLLCAMTVGLIKPSLFKAKSRIPILVFFGSVLLTLLLFGPIFTSESVDNQNIQSNMTRQTSEQSISGQSLEDQIKSQVRNIAATHLSYKEIEIIKADPDRPAGTKMIVVSIFVSSYWDRDGLLRNTGELSSQIFQLIHNAKEPIYDATIWYYGNVEDRYGNQRQDVILTYSMDKATYGKVNWNNFGEYNQYHLCDFLKAEAKIIGPGQGAGCHELVNLE